MRMRHLRVGALVFCAAATLHAANQAPSTSAENPVFAVVSVKPNTTGPGGMSTIQTQPGGRFVATNIPLVSLILQAYRLQSFQLIGAPAWVSTERFDVVAKADTDIQARPSPDPKAPPGPFGLMLRAMLADRFKLRVHTETREVPMYSLVVARTDGKLGPKLTRSATDCAAESAARAKSGEPAPPMPAFGQPMHCGARIGIGSYSAGAATIQQIASQLSGSVGRTVNEQTGLTGNFDVDLTFTPERLPARAPGTPADAPILANGVAIDPNGPTVYTAVQEQLGLKLEPTKGAVDVVVVDSVERPTPD